MQTLSPEGFMELIGHEAIVLEPYFDGGGVLTWGVGHTAAAGAPLPSSMWGKASTVSDVLAILRADLVHYEAQVRAAFTRPQLQTEFDAALLFHYNTGAIGYATWVKKFNAGDRAGAVAGIMSWTIPASIKGRRKKEQLLFDKGIYSNGGKGTIYSTDGKGHIIWSSGKTTDLRPLVQPPAPPLPPFVLVPAPAKLPPAPQLIFTNTKPIQPAPAPSALAPSTPTVKPKATPKPIGFWARLATFLHL